MKSILWVVPLCGLIACGSGKSDQSRDTLTQREKDSILANSRIPNAGVVKRAMTSADSVSAHAPRVDSVARDTTEH